MDFKNYYATLGVASTATHDEIKRAYRKLARKYHPDVSKEPEAEARFKEVAEAHEALIDVERRAAYDDIAKRHAAGQAFEPPPGWDAGTSSGFEYSGRGGDGMPRGPNGEDFSDFFESLFGRASRGGGRGSHRATGSMPLQGDDHHAKVLIDLHDAYSGAHRIISLRMPVLDAAGHAKMQERQLEVRIPKGVQPGQHLRLSGQGGMGQSGAAAGDLYLEIQFRPHPLFRVADSQNKRDIFFDLPVAPWEAALGAAVTAPTPEGAVQLNIPPGSSQGRKLRLKGKGLPGAGQDTQPGDLYAVLLIALPPSDSQPAKDAFEALGRAFADFNPRAALKA